MSKVATSRRVYGTLNVAFLLFLVGCSSEENPSGGSGGAPGAGGLVGSGGATIPSFGGATTQGGTTSSGGAAAGGAPSAGGTVSSGGATPTSGGAASGGAASGGAASGGAASGGAASGGGSAKGGTTGAGGSTSTGGGAGATGTGGGGSGTCEKGTTKGKEVLFIGESFIAASDIPEETTKLARAAGSLAASESYVDKSVSGTWIGNTASNSIPNQYKSNSSGVRYVLMNGGGNDCWQGGKESDRTNALNAAKTLFQDMGKNGVQKVVYFFYPDPIGSNFASLTACLNLLRPEMKKLCEEQTSPKCYWVDLRETWMGHNEYTSDGIHVAGPGNVPTATAIFKSMQANCVAP